MCAITVRPVAYIDSTVAGGRFAPWHTADRTVQFAPVAKHSIPWQACLACRAVSLSNVAA